MVLTLSFGSGHVRAAHAVADAIRAQDPGADVRCVDALNGCRLAFRAIYVWPYWAMVGHARWLWARLFSARLTRVHRQTAPAWVFRAGCPRVFREVARFRPDFILAVEVAACEMATIARRRRLTNAALINVITDHQAEPAWVTPEVDRYLVSDSRVREQLCSWNALPERIVICGIPVSEIFSTRFDPDETRARYGVSGSRPLVLLMGGGMGPTRMDQVAERLCDGDVPMHVVAVTGHDRQARRRLSRIRVRGNTSLTVRGWTDDVPALMQAATVLVTKPGGVTIAEAVVCGTPLLLFDPIPGPEERNAAFVVESGAGVLAPGAEMAAAVKAMLRDPDRRRAMTAAARRLARPEAARSIARMALDACEQRPGAGPVLIFTIGNGAGHTSVASAIAEALHDADRRSAVVVDVADYMSRLARLTHVTAYLWLVKHWPALWDRIDRYQKRQPHTSPEWYYRRTCRRLRDLVGQLDPPALVATEVGCCEIAALIKRDLRLRVPLVAVNGEYDVDRAWLQPEVDLFCVTTEEIRDRLSALGGSRRQIRAWGVPLAACFHVFDDRERLREAVCGWLNLETEKPLLLVAGGSEGLGRVEAAAARLLRLEHSRPQVVVLAGRNERLRQRCERLATRYPNRLRVLGWTSRMPELMRAADLIVSKLGHTFDEAIASGLPLIALEPPPGAERVQYRMLDQWGVGRAVRSLDEMARVVGALLTDRVELDAMRAAAAARSSPRAAHRISDWIDTATLDMRGDATGHAIYAEEPAL